MLLLNTRLAGRSAAAAPVLLRSACRNAARAPSTAATLVLRPTTAATLHTTSPARLRDFFPVKETDAIARTPPSWQHHGYTEQELLGVVPAHQPPETWNDWVAWKVVRVARWFMDKATGMSDQQQVDKKNPTTAVDALQPLTEAQWLVRFVFLESIAGVPGMVGAMLRHLRSLRLMRRDGGWMTTLLEESFNERSMLWRGGGCSLVSPCRRCSHADVLSQCTS
jgi:hypothetical protein